MESLGFLMSIPGGALLSFIYIKGVERIFRFVPRTIPTMKFLTIAILSLLVLEMICLIVSDAPRLNEISGGVFYSTHLVVFFLTVPAFANLYLLYAANSVPKFGAIIFLAIASFFIAGLQYGVTDSLFGPDGMGREGQ
jgi:hypothetical protein